MASIFVVSFSLNRDKPISIHLLFMKTTFHDLNDQMMSINRIKISQWALHCNALCRPKSGNASAVFQTLPPGTLDGILSTPKRQLS